MNINNSIILRASVNISNRKFLPRFESNVGDDLNFYLLEKISNCSVIPYKYSMIGRYLLQRKNYLFIGSIITGLSTDNSIIVGSGVSPDYTNEPMTTPLEIRCVRGPLTRGYLLDHNIKCPSLYGDPALVLPFFYTPKELSKRYKVGFIPHFLDRTDYMLDMFSQYNPEEVIVLNVKSYGHIEDFIDIMNSCDLIFSSSLHGLIFADAYDIPNVWAHFSFDVNRFKYHDYFLSVNREVIDPVVIESIVPVSKLCQYRQLYKPIKIDKAKLLDQLNFA